MSTEPLRDALLGDLRDMSRDAGPSPAEVRHVRNAERSRVDAVWRDRVDAVKARHESPLLHAVLDLHRPMGWLDENEAYCDGCDVAPHSYAPAWPCSTVKLLSPRNQNERDDATD